ncbi:hypothetical protein NPS01_43600 [Nocardioides psychrotolerans]|uniref:Uncharacterized protein n=2 Tax=Nocardioides psychrotolerans TaxID=1005945 RepID=A0A1I3RX43_9ACTN|nr:hypothetical protein NPS01_43600 [Nocardioides psychrotolerans]SFJ49881.1 Protein of Unknown function [Nocardioides psychrotolerans]
MTHLVFLFAVLGGFLAWLVPWVVVPHVASALWGARMAVFRRTCPLSVAENWGSIRPPGRVASCCWSAP